MLLWGSQSQMNYIKVYSITFLFKQIFEKIIHMHVRTVEIFLLVLFACARVMVLCKMYCGIDVSKGKSNICLIGKDSKIIAEFTIKHNKEGFDKLEKYLTKDTKIGLETTGNYCKTIYNYLKKKYNINYVDNVQMFNFAKIHSPSIKNDKVDAKLIAEFLKHDFKELNPLKESKLKDLCKLYQKVVKQLSRYKCMFKDQLNIIFPELESQFCIGHVKSISYMLLKYPSPDLISKTTSKKIFIALNENLKSGTYHTLKYSKRIIELAKNSVGVKDYPIECFKYTIKIMLFYQYQLDEIKRSMKKCLKETPYEKITEEYGFSHTSVATIVGEISDVRRFPTHKHFVSFCGFDVSQKQSGTMNKKGFITKKGNSLLRLTFYMLALGQIKKKDSEISIFFHRLKKKGKHGKTALVACSRKMAIKTYYKMKNCHEKNL